MAGDGRFSPLTLGCVRAESATMSRCSGMPGLDPSQSFRVGARNGPVLKAKRTASRTKDWRRGEVLGSGIGPSHSGISPKPAKQRCDQRHRELSEFITPGEIR